MKINTLFRKYKTQSCEEIFAFYRWNDNAGENWETVYNELAGRVACSKWNFETPVFRKNGQSYPILSNYLNYTFMNVYNAGLVEYSEDRQSACFNTGLLGNYGGDVVLVFKRVVHEPDNTTKRCDWVLSGFEELDVEFGQEPIRVIKNLSTFNRLPERFNYRQRPIDYFFNPDFAIDLTPSVTESIRYRYALKYIRQMALADHKIAVPYWHDGAIRLLLPVCRGFGDEPEAALGVEFDDERQLYIGKVVFPLDIAYCKARIVARPCGWLGEV